MIASTRVELPDPTIRDVDERCRRVHPLAHVSDLAVIGAPGEWRDRPTRHPAILHIGVIVRELARVQAGCGRPTSIGSNTLLMAGCHVGHDTRVGQWCEIAPNAVVGGCCTIGSNVKIGMGAVIKPGVTIGDRARIGMGAVVTKDVPAGETWVGNPARALKPKDGPGSDKWEEAGAFPV